MIGREERLQTVLRELERRFGPWIVFRLKDARPRVAGRSTSRSAPAETAAISTGSLSLDLATGIGGFPRGRISELIGPSGSGKSLFAFHLLANAQQQNGFVAFVDATHRANFEQMARCGIVLADLFLVVPESAREALEVAALLVESGGLDALVLGPLADLVGESRQAGREAAEKVARLSVLLHESPTAVTFVSDLPVRSSAIPLSRALRHFSSLRIQITPLRPLLHPSGDVSGLRVRAETIKNRLAAAQRQTELDLRRDRGVHQESDLVDLGLARAILEELSAGICFGEQFLGRGRSRAVTALEDDPVLAQSISQALQKHLWVPG